jgi:hypothetical protein
MSVIHKSLHARCLDRTNALAEKNESFENIIERFVKLGRCTRLLIETATQLSRFALFLGSVKVATTKTSKWPALSDCEIGSVERVRYLDIDGWRHSDAKKIDS